MTLPNTPPLQDLIEARALCIFGDSTPSQHITTSSPPENDLLENDQTLARRTFAHPQLKNLMTPGIEGGYTQYFGDAPVPAPPQKITATAHAQPTFIYDASIAYQQTGRKLIIIAGDDYGTGPTSDGAAKGTALLGIQAVVAKSIDDTHRAQLIEMGVLPLNFKNKEDYDRIKGINSWTSTFSITGLTLTTSCGISLPLTHQHPPIEEKTSCSITDPGG